MQRKARWKNTGSPDTSAETERDKAKKNEGCRGMEGGRHVQI